MTVEVEFAQILLDCLRTYYTTEHENLPDIAVENFCLIPGTEIAEDIDPLTGVDLCCEGLGWVRIGDAFPSSNWPEPDATLSKCWPVAWSQQYEVGILGCYPTSEHMLSCVTKEQYALQDAARLRALKEVFCCFADHARVEKPARNWTIDSIAVQGPRGGCVSRVASIRVQLPRCCP